MSHLQFMGKFLSAHQTQVKIDEFWFEKLKKADILIQHDKLIPKMSSF
jgi:hypothetical protein